MASDGRPPCFVRAAPSPAESLAARASETAPVMPPAAAPASRCIEPCVAGGLQSGGYLWKGGGASGARRTRRWPVLVPGRGAEVRHATRQARAHRARGGGGSGQRQGSLLHRLQRPAQGTRSAPLPWRRGRAPVKARERAGTRWGAGEGAGRVKAMGASACLPVSVCSCCCILHCGRLAGRWPAARCQFWGPVAGRRAMGPAAGG